MIDDVTLALIRDRKMRKDLIWSSHGNSCCSNGWVLRRQRLGVLGEYQKNKKSGIDFWREERATGCSEAFTGRRCPHSFTECITAIFKDEVILFWVICEDICSVNRSWYHDVIQDVTSNSSDRIIAITCTELPRHSWGRLMLLEPECS